MEATALDGGRHLEAGHEETLPGVKIRPEGRGQGRVHRLGPIRRGGLELVDHGSLTYSEICHRKGHLKMLHHHHHHCLPSRGPEPVGGDHAGDDGQHHIGQHAPATDIKHRGARVSNIGGETELKRDY